MNTPQLLQDCETCPRKGFLGRSWEPQRLLATRMVMEAVRVSLVCSGEQEWGELAGSEVMQLAEDRGLDADSSHLYESVIHHAALADLLVSAIRKPSDLPWLVPEPSDNWTSGCFLSPDGSSLRRVVLVSHWQDERHYSECRSWQTLGEIAAYNLPMQLVICVIGQQRNGKRHGPWTMGYLHPQNHQLRFRKRHKGSRAEGNVFNDRWEKIFREDHAEIERQTWLQSMLTDDVLPEVLFRVDVPIPEAVHLQHIRDMAARKLERLYSIQEKPEANLSTCDWPVPCVFRKCCHVLPEREPSGKNGFIEITPHIQASLAGSCKST